MYSYPRQGLFWGHPRGRNHLTPPPFISRLIIWLNSLPLVFNLNSTEKKSLGNPNFGVELTESCTVQHSYSRECLACLRVARVRVCYRVPCIRFNFVGSLRVSAAYLSILLIPFLAFALYVLLVSFFCRIYLDFYMCSRWSFVNIPLVFSCPAIRIRTGLTTFA